MGINNENFLLADDSSDSEDGDGDGSGNENDYNFESIYVYDLRENKKINKEEEINEQTYNNYIDKYKYNDKYNDNDKDTNENSPRLVNVSIDKSWKDELNAYFKLNNLFTCIKNDENIISNKIYNYSKKQKQDMSVSKIIMNNIIDKKLGSVTYHYENKKSAKAYYTYDYPELYYNKKLYNNISEWLNEEFSKKI